MGSPERVMLDVGNDELHRNWLEIAKVVGELQGLTTVH